MPASWELVKRARRREADRDLAPGILIIQINIEGADQNDLVDGEVHHAAPQATVGATDIDHVAVHQKNAVRKDQDGGHAALQGVSNEENQGADLVRGSTNQDLGLKIIVAPLALLSLRNSKSRKQWNLQRINQLRVSRRR